MKKSIPLFLSILLMAKTEYSSASVQYTYIVPHLYVDTYVAGIQVGNWNVDLNNDGITDFFFSSYWYQDTGAASINYQLYIRIHSDSDNFVIVKNNNLINSAGCHYINPLPFGYPINDTCNWYSTLNNGQSLVDTDTGGYWLDTTIYIGVKFKIGSQYHYGWIKGFYQIIPNPFIVVYECAYERTPEQPITADNTVSGIETNKLSLINIYPNPANSRIKIMETAEKGSINGIVKVLDITGNLVFQAKLPHDNEIDISSLTNGLYFIQTENKKRRLLGKFVKE